MDDFRKRLEKFRAGKSVEGRQSALLAFNQLLNMRFAGSAALQDEFLQTVASPNGTMVRVGAVSRDILIDKDKYSGRMKEIVDTSVDEDTLRCVKSFFDWVEELDLRAIFIGKDLYLLPPDSDSCSPFIQELRQAQRMYALEHCDYGFFNDAIASRFQSRDQIESEFMSSAWDWIEIGDLGSILFDFAPGAFVPLKDDGSTYTIVALLKAQASKYAGIRNLVDWVEQLGLIFFISLGKLMIAVPR